MKSVSQQNGDPPREDLTNRGHPRAESRAGQREHRSLCHRRLGGQSRQILEQASLADRRRVERAVNGRRSFRLEGDRENIGGAANLSTCARICQGVGGKPCPAVSSDLGSDGSFVASVVVSICVLSLAVVSARACISLGNLGATGAGGLGPFDFTNRNAGSPGTALAWTNTQSVTTSPTKITFTAPQLSLAASTPYWLVVDGSAGLTWLQADPNAAATAQNSSGWNYTPSKFTTDGTAWSALNNENSLSVSAVPEPASLLACTAAAAAVAGGYLRRRSRKA